MSRKPSNATHRKRLRDVTNLSYGDYRWAVDMVPCPVCGAKAHLACLPYASHGPHQVHTPRLLLSQLIPKGDSLLAEQEEFIRTFGAPDPTDPRKRSYPKR